MDELQRELQVEYDGIINQQLLVNNSLTGALQEVERIRTELNMLLGEQRNVAKRMQKANMEAKPSFNVAGGQAEPPQNGSPEQPEVTIDHMEVVEPSRAGRRRMARGNGVA